MVPTVAQIAEVIEELAPGELSVGDDPVGIQCGEQDRQVRKIMFALDAGTTTVDQALELQTDLLVTHHPLLFQPLGQGMDQSPAGIAFVKAVRGKLAVYSAHTNLDASPNGINRLLSDLLQIREAQVICPSDRGAGFKVVVFVPLKDLVPVREAAFKAGAGRIGNYSRCSFTVTGEGTFLGNGKTVPSVGVPGIPETVKEARLEIRVPDACLRPLLESVRKSHPYEEPVLDIIPLNKRSSVSGIGLHGLLPTRMSVNEIAAALKKATGASCMRFVGKKGKKVRYVAVCAGSGASLMKEVVESGAELFITGDVKYHEARNAEEIGLSVLDIGHFAPERYGMLRFGKLMENRFREMEWNIKTDYAKEKDPFKPVTLDTPGDTTGMKKR